MESNALIPASEKKDFFSIKHATIYSYMSTLIELQKKHPVFRYQKFDVSHHDEVLHFQFTFQIDPDITFHPTVSIHSVSEKVFQNLSQEVLDNLAFHLGLIEIPS